RQVAAKMRRAVAAEAGNAASRRIEVAIARHVEDACGGYLQSRASAAAIAIGFKIAADRHGSRRVEGATVRGVVGNRDQISGRIQKGAACHLNGVPRAAARLLDVGVNENVHRRAGAGDIHDRCLRCAADVCSVVVAVEGIGGGRRVGGCVVGTGRSAGGMIIVTGVIARCKGRITNSAKCYERTKAQRLALEHSFLYVTDAPLRALVCSNFIMIQLLVDYWLAGSLSRRCRRLRATSAAMASGMLASCLLLGSRSIGDH